MVSLLAIVLLASLQAVGPVLEGPYDRVVRLEIAAVDEPGIVGRGPTAAFEYEVEFQGALHIWADSEVDLFLQVDDASAVRTLASDDNSGGGTVPYVAVDVKPGDWLVILAASPPGTPAMLELHLVAAPETDEGRKAEAAGRAALGEAARLMEGGERAAAREVLASALPQVMGTAGVAFPGLMGVRGDLAAWLGRLGDLEGAHQVDQSILSDSERSRPRNHLDLLSARGNLALSLTGMGDLAGALALNESVAAAFARTLPADHPDLLRAQANLAGMMHQIGDFAGARALRQTVLQGLERTLQGDHPELLRARANMANSMQEMGDHSGARALFESVIASYERLLPADHPDLLLARANLAISMRRTGDLVGARAVRESVLAVYERNLPGDHPDLLRARINLATSMHEMGDLAGARALSESCLNVYERTLPEGHEDLIAARLNLAASMHDMGDIEGARSLYETILASLELTLPEGHPDRLIAQANLAGAMLLMGDLVAARGHFESVLATYERTLPETHLDLLAARANLANSVFSMEDYATAESMFEANLVTYERILPDGHPDLTRVAASLAVVKVAMGKYADAHELFQSVLAECEARLPADHPDLSRALAHLALCKFNLGDAAGARALLPELVAGIRKRVLGSVALAPRQAREAVWSEGARLAEVFSLSESGDSELEGLAFELTETMRLVAAEAARSLARFETDPELRPLLDKAADVRRQLNDLVAGVSQSSLDVKGVTAAVTRLSLERDGLEREASQKLAERGVVIRPIAMASLSQALEVGEAAVGYRRMAHLAVGKGDHRRRFPDDHLIAQVLTSDGVLTRIDLGLASELEDVVGDWRAGLGAPVYRGVAVEPGGAESEVEAGRRLRARVLDPVLKAAGAELKRLFVCADDLLFLVPLEALPASPVHESATDGGVSRVGDLLRIVNEVSFARLMARRKPIQTAPSLLVVGGVDYDARGSALEGSPQVSAPLEAQNNDSYERASSGAVRGESGEMQGRASSPSGTALPERFEKLLQTRLEAEATGILFEDAFQAKPTYHMGRAATKAALFASAAGKRYLHLATHGWFAPESVRSVEDPQPAASGARMNLERRLTGLAPMTLCGIAMAGANLGRDSLGRVAGILTAEEMCSLDLSQCELAVLSACETNVGIRRAGQGIQSIQAALYAAGVRTSLTSLWRVDDGATRRLMEVFYSNLWGRKMSKAEALWQAKRALRDEGHPVSHWAGWVLTGDPE